MSHNLLQGKRGIIFGALDENSIAWKVAEEQKRKAPLCSYQCPIALRKGDIFRLAERQAVK
jgi:enoyl-[acyl-carrier protein] reductase I